MIARILSKFLAIFLYFKAPFINFEKQKSTKYAPRNYKTMATLTPCIKHIKKNGTAAVKVKLSHNSTHAFLDTKLVVTQKELIPDGKL